MLMPFQRLALIILGVIVVIETSDLIKNSLPQPGQMIEYALTELFSELGGQIHQSNDNVHNKQALARDYYRVLFSIWFGTRYIPTREAIRIDPRGYIRAFQKASVRENFSNLIDYDDPLGWNRLPPNYDKQEIIDAVRGVDYYTWILEQTKDPVAYKKAVHNFRLFTESVKHDPDFL